MKSVGCRVEPTTGTPRITETSQTMRTWPQSRFIPYRLLYIATSLVPSPLKGGIGLGTRLGYIATSVYV